MILTTSLTCDLKFLGIAFKKGEAVWATKPYKSRSGAMTALKRWKESQ